MSLPKTRGKREKRRGRETQTRHLHAGGEGKGGKRNVPIFVFWRGEKGRKRGGKDPKKGNNRPKGQQMNAAKKKVGRGKRGWKNSPKIHFPNTAAKKKK